MFMGATSSISNFVGMTVRVSVRRDPAAVQSVRRCCNSQHHRQPGRDRNHPVQCERQQVSGGDDSSHDGDCERRLQAYESQAGAVRPQTPLHAEDVADCFERTQAQQVSRRAAIRVAFATWEIATRACRDRPIAIVIGIHVSMMGEMLDAIRMQRDKQRRAGQDAQKIVELTIGGRTIVGRIVH